jgi:hypothetical protein
MLCAHVESRKKPIYVNVSKVIDGNEGQKYEDIQTLAEDLSALGHEGDPEM